VAFGLHGRVADFSDGQLSAQATLIKGHSLGAVAIKEQEGHEIHQGRCSLSFFRFVRLEL
jgi:hypothetical protein